jgi:hypothetical protein
VRGRWILESWLNPDSTIPADAMSEEQTFRSEVNGSLEMKGMMEYWSVGAETHYSTTPLLQPHEVTFRRFNYGIRVEPRFIEEVLREIK